MSPYLPVASLSNRTTIILLEELKKELEEVKHEFVGLKRLGFNIVRLLVMWKAIEPIPNPNLDQLLPEGQHYLNLVKEIIDALYSYGFFVIIDFHQDIAHEIYGGDGFPDWALAIDETHRRPPQSDLKDKSWAGAYYLNRLVRHTLQSFWRNHLTNIEFGLKAYPVRTHLEKTIGQTVKFFKELNGGQGHPAILGFELFNEPHQVTIDKKTFEEYFLREFYTNVLSEIKKFNNKVFVFIEPRVDWNIYSPLDIIESHLDWSNYHPSDVNLELQLGFIHDPSQIKSWIPTDSDFLDQFKSQGVFSFHHYDPWTLIYSFFNTADNMYNKQTEWPSIFYQFRHAAILRGLVPFLTEFGGSQDWEYLKTNLEPYSIYHGKQIRAYMNLQFIQIEKYLLNAIYWNYDLYNTDEGKDNWNLENFSLLGPSRTPRNIDIVARPYPLRSSAEPRLLFFDLETKYCVIILQAPVVEAPTIIYVPYDIHYLPNFNVWSTSSSIDWDKNNQFLYWYPDSSKELNQIIIGPVQNLATYVLPEESRRLLAKTTFIGKFD